MVQPGISRAVRARVRDAPPLARGRTLPANRVSAAMVSVAVSADWDCGPRAVDAPRQRHHAQHQRLHSTTAAPCTWSAPWQASASAPAPGRHQALTQQQAQQHALELREQMPSVLRPSKRLHPGPRTLVCEPDKGVTFTFVGSSVGTFWIFRASS